MYLAQKENIFFPHDAEYKVVSDSAKEAGMGTEVFWILKCYPLWVNNIVPAQNFNKNSTYKQVSSKTVL